jgi:hypothetical protein
VDYFQRPQNMNNDLGRVNVRYTGLFLQVFLVL